MRTHVLSLLDRHSSVLRSFKWTEFDDEFLTKNVESVTVADVAGPKVNTVHSFHFKMSFFSLMDEMFLLYSAACGSEGS